MARDDCSVKHFLSSHTGAPVLNGVAGSRAAVMDACLVNGWGVTAVSSITVAAASATLNFSTAHPFAVHQVIKLMGAAPVADGEYRVRTVAANSVTVGVDDAVADQTISSGGMTAALAPAGWELQFTSGLKRVYRSANPLAVARFSYRLDDSAAQYGRITGYVSMSGVDAGAEPFGPNGAAGGYIPGSSAASSTSRNWAVVADGRLAYMLFCSNAGYPLEPTPTVIGEPDAYLNSDLFSALNVSGASSNVQLGSPGGSTPAIDGAHCIDGWYLARGVSGSVGAVAAFGGVGTGGGSASGSASFAPTTQGPPVLLPMFYGSGTAIRGRLPGLMFSAAYLGDRTGWATFGLNSATAGPLAGRRYLLCTSGGYTTATSERHYWIDATGPWR